MLESAALQREVAADRSLVVNPLLFGVFFVSPVAELKIPSESRVLSAAPSSACNCPLSA